MIICKSQHFFVILHFVMMMTFHVDIIDLLLKGILIGVIASAPMGPVGVLCIRRTLNKGRWFGLITGFGAAVSDIMYAAITGYGMSFVMDFVNSPSTQSILQTVGSIVLLIFGVITFRSDPMKKAHASAPKPGSLIHNGVTGFLITVSNPTIVFLFAACFAQFAFVIPDYEIGMVLGFTSIFVGAMLWWYGLTWLIDLIREKFSTDGIVIINRVIGTIVIFFSLIVLIGIVFNLYTIRI